MEGDSLTEVNKYKNLTRSCLSTLNPVDSIIQSTIHHADNMHEVSC